MARTVPPKVAKLMQQGLQLMQVGAFPEAGRAFERAVQQMPDLADAHAMRADALMRAGKLDVALSAVERALRLVPGWGEALMLRGNILALLERFADAEASMREAMRMLGPTPALQANLGNVLFEQERFADALEAYDAALAAGENVELLARRARALDRLGRLDACESAWQRVLEREPGNLEALERLANLGLQTGRQQLVERACRNGAELAATAPSFQLGLAVSLMWRGADDEAIHHFERAAALAPDDADIREQALAGKATALFQSGRLREAWETYFEHYQRRSLAERYPRLVLTPQEFSALRPSTLCIHPAQGIGDQLFFLRFAPAARAAGHRLLLKADPKLCPLLTHRQDLFDWVGVADDSAPQYDADIFASDLALSDPGSVPPALQLAIDPGRYDRMRAALRDFGPPPYLGVTWRGGLTQQEQKAWRGRVWLKQVPPCELGRAVSGVRASLVILQRSPEPEEVSDFREGAGRDALDLSRVNDDLADAATALSVLSEYAGVSNTNMHLLAGITHGHARVLVTNPPAEWRWGREGPHSPWFPRFTLYRQGASFDWNGALSALAADLSAVQKP